MKCSFCKDKKATKLRYKPTKEYPIRYDLCDECAGKHKRAWRSVNKAEKLAKKVTADSKKINKENK